MSSSPPASPSSPIPASAELTELKAIVAMQTRNLEALQALHHHSVQTLQASMEAASRRSERRFDELLTFLKLPVSQSPSPLTPNPGVM